MQQFRGLESGTVVRYREPLVKNEMMQYRLLQKGKILVRLGNAFEFQLWWIAGTPKPHLQLGQEW